MIDMMNSLDPYWDNKQGWKDWGYEYAKNNVGEREDNHNEEYYLDEYQVTDNGLYYCCGGAIPNDADDGEIEDREFNVKELLH